MGGGSQGGADECEGTSYRLPLVHIGARGGGRVAERGDELCLMRVSQRLGQELADKRAGNGRT